MRIVATDPANPVRNISIVPVAAEANFLAKPYQPGFIDLVKGGWLSVLLAPPAMLLSLFCVFACTVHSISRGIYGGRVFGRSMQTQHSRGNRLCCW